MRGAISVFLAGLILLMLAGAVTEMPTYGEPNPTHNFVYDRYIRMGVEETGAINAVTQIVMDYRAYDTLIETTVLFAAIASVLLVLKSARKEDGA